MHQAHTHDVSSSIPAAAPASVWGTLQHFTAAYCDGTDSNALETNVSPSIVVDTLVTVRSYKMPCANALENAIRNMCETGCYWAMEVYAYAYNHGPEDIARISATSILSYPESERVHCPALRVISGRAVLHLYRHQENVKQKILSLFHGVWIGLISPEMVRYIVYNGPLECQGDHFDEYTGVYIRQWWLIACQIARDHINTFLAPLSRLVFDHQFIMRILETTNCPHCRDILIRNWGDICSAVRARMYALADTVNLVIS